MEKTMPVQSRRPRICLLLMGGSTLNGMRELGFTISGQSESGRTNLIPEAKFIADTETIAVTHEQSTAFIPEVHWPMLAKAIAANYKRFDGFVVIHGKDTIISTACGMAFMLQNLGKPVIFTGSSYHASDRVLQAKYRQVIEHNLTTDTKLNILNAIVAATLDLAEVALVFDEHIISATCAKRFRELSRNIFKSFTLPPLGKIGPDSTVYSHARKRHKKPLIYTDQLNWKVACLTAFQGMPPESFDAFRQLGYEGFVLSAFGVGTYPRESHNNWGPKLDELVEQKVPITFVSTTPDGLIDLTLYEYQQELEKKGLISGHSMTRDAAYAKLMWAMGQTHDLKKIKRLMETNLIGELPTV